MSSAVLSPGEIVLVEHIPQDNPYQIIIDTASPHFKETGLKCSSAIKCGYIFAYPKNRIKLKLGYVSQAVLENIIRVITSILA